MDKLVIDICLATKNSLITLPRMLDSLNQQKNLNNARLLVADNKSNDGTLNILRENKLTKIISFIDNSPEDGFNKLLKNDQNNLKILVSSDDWLSKNYLEAFSLCANKLKRKGIKNLFYFLCFIKILVAVD